MPAPTSVDEFVDLIRKSSILEEPRLSAYVQKLKADPNTATEINGVAGLFVRDGLLTYFQAEQFLQGKWKRFTIGKYKVLEKLGSGGMGQVFLCEHKLMRRRVAVKVLPTAKASDPSSLERFYREARAVAALDHQNIVRAYDIDQDENLHFLVMEYVDGSSLQDIIRKTGPMNVTRACHYMYWSAIGLQHAHAAGLIHRDIKPGNILVDRQGVVKILDLGLARFFNDDQDLLTKKYDESVLGTADYLAPEQAVDSHTVDGRADIYSLGATFYFLLTGNPPFAEGTVAQKLLWHQTRTPKPVREVRPEVPADVAAVLGKMMSKKPEDRYQTPAHLSEALLKFTQTPIPPPPDIEMPQLSAAAQGTASGPMTVTAAPRTIATAPRTPPPVHAPRATATAGAPAASPPPAPSPPVPAPGKQQAAGVAVADVETRRNKPAPVVEPIPDSVPGGSPIWEAISAETANTARADTDRKRRDGRSSRKYKPAPPDLKFGGKSGSRSGRGKTRKPFPLGVVLAIAAGVVLIIAGVVATYWFGFRDKKTSLLPTGTEPRTLVLTKNPTGPLQYASVQKAIADFRTGDRMEFADPVWEEDVVLSRVKGLVLTAPEGKRVVWRSPPGRASPQLLSLHGIDGGRISGITFQAEGRDHAIRIAGACPGLVIEEVECLDATSAPLVINDCTGERDRPAVIRRTRLANPGGKESRAAALFTSDQTATAKVPNPPGYWNVKFVNCVIEGPYRVGAFDFYGTALGVEISHCRVWKAGSGVHFGKNTPSVWRVDVVGNTFHTMTRAGIEIEDAVAMKRPENQIAFRQNYFLYTPAVSQVTGDTTDARFLSAEGNFRKNGTPPGSPLTPTTEIDVELPADPNDRVHFLMYDRSSPLFKAYNDKSVGAPPE
jgi:eukaryotic-like serine/threonine-protein kinase